MVDFFVAELFWAAKAETLEGILECLVDYLVILIIEAFKDEKVEDGLVNELRYLLCWILFFIAGIVNL